MPLSRSVRPGHLKRRHKNRHRFWPRLMLSGALLFVFVLMSLLLLTTGAAAAGAYLLYRDLEDNVTALAQLDGWEGFQSTRIYDRHGVLLNEIFGPGRRRFVPLEETPQVLLQATIAAEDSTFWTNSGFELQAVLRAAARNLRQGEIVSGGSTITQQLVRQVAMSPAEAGRRTYWRKLKEVVLAFFLTKTRSKEAILELYLNEVYYGHLAYGAQMAARVYFDKKVTQLSLAEAAMLAGLPQSPSILDPLRDPQAPKARQGYVLARMVGEGFITPAEARQAYAQPLRWNRRPGVVKRAPHFVDYVERLLLEQFDRRTLAQGGLDVYTTLDLGLNEHVQALAAQQIRAIREAHRASNAAVVVLQPGAGDILAMVGSIDYQDSSIDGQVNVAIRQRQPGSAIKPVTYAAALEDGASTALLLQDERTVIPLSSGRTYEPRNYDGRFHGPVRLRTALANSYNVPAVRLVEKLGVPRFLEQAHRMGIRGLNRGPQWYGPSITLGGGEVSLLDMATMYATLANLGQRVEPTAILRVERGGEPVEGWRQPQPAQSVLDPRIAYVLTDVLADDRARQPAFGARNPLDLPFPAAAKTGTSNDFRDNWTLGYTPRVVVGVWVGNSDNTPMVNTSGITGAAPLWREVMLALHGDPRLASLAGPEWYERPGGLVERDLCDGVNGCWAELFREEVTACETGLSPEQAIQAILNHRPDLRGEADSIYFQEPQWRPVAERARAGDPEARRRLTENWLTADPANRGKTAQQVACELGYVQAR